MSEANKINLINICDSCICVHGVLLELSVFKSKSPECDLVSNLPGSAQLPDPKSACHPFWLDHLQAAVEQ